ncbi:MAG: phosphotriesterase [Flammeovirgaceae bacterium]|nr:phosphotriesterase [Flammeovirgaceae bacterium]
MKLFPLIFTLFLLSCQSSSVPEKALFVNTVNGEIPVEELGFALPHEHVMSNFGAEINETDIYDEAKLFAQVISYLKEVKSLGVKSIFDCTAAYFGRNVKLLKELSDSSGMQIITNTGIYGAANDKYIPEFIYEKSAEAISKIWIDEFENGIGGTGIKPGFIKLAFDGGAPSEIDLKLFEAGVIAHLATGLTLAVHTGNNTEAVEKQLEILSKYGVEPSAWIWVHANKMENSEALIETSKKGGWISLDGVKAEKEIQDHHIKLLKDLKREGLLKNVLISHDGNSFPKGKAIRPYDAIPKLFMKALKENGFSRDEIYLLTQKNPQEAFGIRIRKVK